MRSMRKRRIHSMMKRGTQMQKLPQASRGLCNLLRMAEERKTRPRQLYGK